GPGRRAGWAWVWPSPTRSPRPTEAVAVSSAPMRARSSLCTCPPSPRRGWLHPLGLALERPDVVGQRLGRELVGGEADALVASLVEQDHERRVVHLGGDGVDGVVVPDPAHLTQRPVDELQAPGQLVLGQKRPTIAGGVLGLGHADPDR